MGDATSMSLEQETPVGQPSKDLHPANEETIVTKPNFADRIAGVKASASAHLQKATQLLNPAIPQEEPQKPANPQDVLNQLEALGQEESLSPSEFLSQSRPALQVSTQIIDLALAQEKELKQQAYPLQSELEIDIDPKIQELNRVRGIRKFLGVRKEKSRLTTQKSNMQSQLTELEKQIQAKKQLIDQFEKQEEPVRQKQEKALLVTEEALMAEVGQEIAAIRSDYEQLLQDILEDGSVAADIRETYIEQIASPYMDEKFLGQEMAEGKKKDEFYKALRTYIAHGEQPGNRMSTHRQLLDSFHCNGDYLAEPLLDGKDKKIIELLVAKIAMHDIDPIRIAAESRWGEWRFRMTFGKALGPMDRSTDGTKTSFGQKIMDEFNQPKSLDLYDESVMLWQGVKYSRKANELFGEEIQKQDQRYYFASLDESLGPKKGRLLKDFSMQDYAIRHLRYYPTPDAIRNLVLLASTHESSNIIDKANSTLFDLSKRKDWQEILYNAIKAYPSLKTARPSLEKSSSTPSTELPFAVRRPEIQDAVSDFARLIFETYPENSRLKTLALQALPNRLLQEILVNKGAISEKELLILKKAEDVLEKAREESVQRRNKDDDSAIPAIGPVYFKHYLRENMLDLFSQDKQVDARKIIGRFVILSQKIVTEQTGQTDYSALSFFSSNELLSILKGKVDEKDITPLLNAYKDCPALVSNSMLLTEFCFQFKGGETIQLFKDISTAYSSFPDRLLPIIRLVAKSDISKERALELPTKAGDIIGSPIFPLLMQFPDIFLQEDEALVFMQEFIKKGLDLLDPSLNLSFRQKIFKQTKDFTGNNRAINQILSRTALTYADELLTANPDSEINESNWRSLLMAFVETQEAGNFVFKDQSRKRIKELFMSSRVKDFCINSFRKEYSDYLASGNLDQIPFTLYLTTEYIKHTGGAGPLTQIESLSNFVSVFCASLGQKATTEESRSTAFQAMYAMENRFSKEKWSNENRTGFYNISSDILSADPNLFFDFMKAFDNLNPSDLKRFMREIYPLYGVRLALIEKTDEKGSKTYDEVQLASLRKDVQAFTESSKTQEKPFEAQKAKLIGEISILFKERFGIAKIPKEFTEENIRSLTNVSLYLANINARNATKEMELGYYLALMLNNRWDDFRRGEIIDPKEFLDPKKAEVMTGILKKRAELNPITPENLGIQGSDIPEFLRVLQEETQNVAVGDIETIDVKLNNVILNLRQLQDPDLYPDSLDKQRMQLLLSFGNKKVGSTAAKMYQALQGTSRPIQFSEEELQIRKEITRIAVDGNLELTADNIKKHFQEGIRPLSTMTNMLQFVDETQAENEIEKIRQLLKPSQEIIDVFNRLGEEFQPTSGALALSSDLDYLDNIIVKKESSLNPNEKALLVDYTGKIREQVIKLQDIFDKIKNKFSSLKQGTSQTNNQLLKDKLDQIDTIINAPSTQQPIVSTMTGNLNTIIENMRACLSCTTKGENNDTNLTFGDTNKFYLYSQQEGQAKGSISDEILFLEPVARQDGTSEIAFVFDRIYGVQTPTILTNQLETVIKKYRQLKQKYPKAKLSIFVTDSAIQTAGLSQEMLMSKVQNTGNNAYVKEEELTVDVAESAMADHYIEFGGNGRSSGKRNVKGIAIRL